MKLTLRKTLAISTVAASIAFTPIAMSHLNDKEMAQSYRQSWFAMVASNFGPMAAMMKGDMPYDLTRMQAHANDLSTLMELDILRGFAPGTEKGTTRAKPSIWENSDDFKQKMEDMRTAVTMLQEAAKGGEKGAIGKGIGATGKSCKGCHKEYKSKDYLY